MCHLYRIITTYERKRIDIRTGIPRDGRLGLGDGILIRQRRTRVKFPAPCGVTIISDGYPVACCGVVYPESMLSPSEKC
jgi:hypothetical protein